MRDREITSWLLLALALWIGSCCRIEPRQPVKMAPKRQPREVILVPHVEDMEGWH
jgi:hypothetical protein